jgi:hypothetical protein
MHIYTNTKKDVMVPSVTTIITYVKTKPEYDSLIKWANSLGYKHQDFYDVLNTAADFGTIVHDVLAHIVTDRPIPSDASNKIAFNDMQKYNSTISNFLAFYRQTKPTTIYSEKSMLSKELGFGGTIDWLSIEDGKTILTDFKTSSAFREYMFIQLAAYTKLIETQTKYHIDSARIMLVSTDSFRRQELNRTELDRYYRIFDLMCQLYKEYNTEIDASNTENSLIIVDD